MLEDGLDVAGTGTVGLTGGTATIAGAATLPNLTQTGGTLNGSGTLTVTGLINWTGGEMSAGDDRRAGAEWPSAIRWATRSSWTSDSRERRGRHSGRLQLGLRPGPFIGRDLRQSGGGQLRLHHRRLDQQQRRQPFGGHFPQRGYPQQDRRRNRDQHHRQRNPLTNTGTLKALSGTISLQGGGTLASKFTVTGDVSLDAGPFVLENGVDVVGTGTVGLTGGTATIAGAARLCRISRRRVEQSTAAAR